VKSFAEMDVMWRKNGVRIREENNFGNISGHVTEIRPPFLLAGNKFDERFWVIHAHLTLSYNLISYNMRILVHSEILDT
jgi:hypothetical protein